MKAEEVARVCHEANRALTYILQDVPVQSDWDLVDIDMRTSSIKGVQFALDNPDVTAEQMHEQWCKERREAGWVYGETKDSVAKTHPALKPFSELHDGVKRKDAVFRAIVQALR
jgi:hypothetical protein